MAWPAPAAGVGGAAAGPVVIVAGYLGLFLVLGVGSALLVVFARRASRSMRVFLRCVRWGLSIGVVTGALFGAALPVVGLLEGDAGPILTWALVGLFYGAIVGAVVAVIPTMIGAVFVRDLLLNRYSQPSSEESVLRDLTAAFSVVVGVLDVILLAVLVAVMASGTDVASAALSFAFFLAGNVCVAAMLWRARISITRLWMAVGWSAAASGGGRFE